MNIWITGKNGQLGSELFSIQKYFGHQFFFTSTQDVDITDSTSVTDFISENAIELVINCAAYTAVDKAEEDIENANKVNHIGVRNIVQACEKFHAKLIHISTDYVFNGESEIALKPTDQVNPIGVYGQTKLNGEKAILESTVEAIIIRTAWVYSTFGNNFVKTMIRLGKEKEALNVVGDQFGSPTYAKDLAMACMLAAENQNAWNSENKTYHYTNEGQTNWSEFAQEIMNLSNLECKISAISTEEYPTPAKRPKYSVLDKSSFKTDFNVEIRNWKEALGEMISLLDEK